MKHDAVI